jgi:hypothetical protein
MFTANFPWFFFRAALLLLTLPTFDRGKTTFNHITTRTEVKMAKPTTLKEFESVFPKLVEDILGHAKQYKLPEEFVSWYKAVRLFWYTVWSFADSINYYSP